MLPIVNIAVTGGAGNIAYSLLFRIASGELFGKEQPISLRILEIEESFSLLKGVRMELEDCAYPLLQEIIIDTDPYTVFSDVSIAFLVGAKPRGAGMERKDLLCTNAAIFQKQAMVLNSVAKKDAHILIIGNPCNTNCLIALHNAPNLDPKRFYAMTRLDENRARALIAKKKQCLIQEVSCVPIWGNHSNTQVPDFYNTTIQGIPAIEAIKDENWFLEEFTSMVQNRGMAVIQARGKSSAASAASSALDAMKSIVSITEPGNFFSMAVYTDQNPYNIDRDLVFSFPCITNKKGNIEIVSKLHWNEYIENKIRITEKELQQEREIVKEML